MKRLKRFTPVLTGSAVAALLLGMVLPSVAYAANAHYKKGGKPVCTVSIVGGTGTAACTSGSVAGLGNADVRVSVSIGVSAPTFCHNPGNSSIVPGQNPATAIGSSALLFSPDQIKNGTLTIPPISASVSLAAPSPEVAGCPNGQWTVTVGTPSFGEGTYTFEQPLGTVVPRLSFTF